MKSKIEYMNENLETKYNVDMLTRRFNIFS